MPIYYTDAEAVTTLLIAFHIGISIPLLFFDINNLFLHDLKKIFRNVLMSIFVKIKKNQVICVFVSNFSQIWGQNCVPKAMERISPYDCIPERGLGLGIFVAIYLKSGKKYKFFFQSKQRTVENMLKIWAIFDLIGKNCVGLTSSKHAWSSVDWQCF